MIDEQKKINVINKYSGVVGYDIPELGIHRTFQPKENKNISFQELQRLSFVPGGDVILKDYLEVTDENAVLELFNQETQPEYHYSEEDIKNILLTGSLDQFLDCLDFAPQVVKEMIKDLSVQLEINDISKRKAILEKTGFDVTKAIEIKNTKYDGGDESEILNSKAPHRRTVPLKNEKYTPTGRRYQPTSIS